MTVRHIFRRARLQPLQFSPFRQPLRSFSVSCLRTEIEKSLDSASPLQAKVASGKPLEATLHNEDPPETPPIEKPTEDARLLKGGTPLEDTLEQRTRRRSMLSQKINYDLMSPQPALRHAALLKDILPTTRGPNDEFVSGDLPGNKLHTASPDFLVYWPLQTPPSQLAPDGADKDHIPSGYSVAGPHDPPGQGLRLWKSGRLIFRYLWPQEKPPSFYSKQMCDEVLYEDKPGQGSYRDVDIYRTYKTKRKDGNYTPVIIERRTLRFVKDRVAERVLRASGDDVQSEVTSPVDADHVHDFTTTPAQLFQFSALTFNAHYIHLDPKNGIVHGPLLVALMLRAAEHHLVLEGQAGVRMKRFEYSCIRPLKVGQEARLCLKKTDVHQEWRLWVERRDGRLIAEGLVIARPLNIRRESKELT